MDSANLLPALELGGIVAGKYRIDRTLAEGGMGVVVAATHMQLDQVVALKFLRADVGLEFDARARFTREARAAAQLRSEHVARVLDAGVTDDGTPYIAMEYLEGQSLARALQVNGPMDVTRAVECVIQVCEGLAEAHSRGIVHRDIKPYNLFLVERSPGWSAVKILDFGISKFAFPDASNVATGVILGSPCYMSPEQLRSTATVDHRTDIWSVGATLYELLAGRSAFDASQTLPSLITAILDQTAPDVRSAREDVPAELAVILARCLAKDREARFASAGELAMALLPFGPPRARVNAELATTMRPAFPPNEGPAPSNPPPSTATLRALPPFHKTPVPTVPPSSDRLQANNEATGQSNQLVAPVALTLVAEDPPDRKTVEDRLPTTRSWQRMVVIAAVAALALAFLAVRQRGGAPDAGTPAPAEMAPRQTMAPPISPGPAPLPALVPTVSAPPERLELVVRASPAEARVTIDDRPVANPFVASYPKDGSVHRIAAHAWGYEPKVEEVPFDADLIVDLGLLRHSSVTNPPANPLAPAAPDKRAALASAEASAPHATPASPPSPVPELDSAGGRAPLHAIETKDPYGVP